MMERMQEAGLNSKQDEALGLALMGKTDTEIARRVGVSRVTVNQWRNHDEDFVNELRNRRKQLWDRQREGLLVLCGKAMEVLGKSLASPDEKVRLRAAMELLRMPAIQENLMPEKQVEEKEEFDMLDLLGEALGTLEAEGRGVTPRREEGEGRNLINN